MAGADEVETGFFHLAHLADFGIVESSGTQHTVVVMYTGTVDEYFLTVEHETILGVEREGADAEFRGEVRGE